MDIPAAQPCSMQQTEAACVLAVFAAVVRRAAVGGCAGGRLQLRFSDRLQVHAQELRLFERPAAPKARSQPHLAWHRGLEGGTFGYTAVALSVH